MRGIEKRLSDDVHEGSYDYSRVKYTTTIDAKHAVNGSIKPLVPIYRGRVAQLAETKQRRRF
jgi:hypothetical protein